MFCDNCGEEISNTALAFTFSNGDVVCESCWEDHQDDDEPGEEGE